MKTSNYMNIIEKDDYCILHNPLYGSMMKVTDAKLKGMVNNIKSQKGTYDFTFDTAQETSFYRDLINQKMIIENQINEINILNLKFREWQLAMSKKMGVIMLPTRNCNFRCPYCYEDHDSDFMTDDTYNSTLNWIVQNVQKRRCEQVGISWFGGEPMLVYDKIISFMQRLKAMNPDVRISGQMTTNGYLLTQDKLQELIRNGVTNFQITVDGMANIHDKTRYLAGGGKTWDVITKNLLCAKSLNEKFTITIRTNMSRELVDNPDEWFEYLKRNFADDSRFMFHCETIKDLGGENKEYAYTHGGLREDPMQYILSLYEKYGLRMENYTRYLQIFSIICYAANPYHVIVDYDGTVEKCTVCIDETRNKVGKIDKDGLTINENNYAWWVDYKNNTECEKCEVYPICYGRKCPNSYYQSETCDNLLHLYKSIIKTAY